MIVSVVDLRANDHGASRIKGLFHHGAMSLGVLLAAVTTDAFPTSWNSTEICTIRTLRNSSEESRRNWRTKKGAICALGRQQSYMQSQRIAIQRRVRQRGVNSLSASREFRIDYVATSIAVPAIKDICHSSDQGCRSSDQGHSNRIVRRLQLYFLVTLI
jgi:hypothetical protein